MRRLFVLTLALLLSAKAIDAETIFDSVDLTSELRAHSICSGAVSPNQDWAFAFEVPGASDFTLDFLELRLGLVIGPNEIRVVVHEDAGLEPGGVLEEFLLIDALPPCTHDTPLLRIDSVARPVLRAGNRYWVAAHAPEPEQVWQLFEYGWFMNLEVAQTQAVSLFRNPWNVFEAEAAQFRVAATPTACSDGADNDGDGLLDFPDDPGCWDTASIIENPQCQDGEDNDGDGTIDFDGGLSALGYVAAAPDPQCTYGWQGREARPSCGVGAELALLLTPLMWFWRRRV